MNVAGVNGPADFSLFAGLFVGLKNKNNNNDKKNKKPIRSERPFSVNSHERYSTPEFRNNRPLNFASPQT